MADLKRAVKKLVQEFKEADAWAKSEEDVQASFTLALLRKLGWGPANWQVNTGTTPKPANKPDIVLKDDAGFTVLVIESKAPKRELGLKTQEEQLFRYAGHEGKYWGILTNFIEWRVYATYPPCIYKKFAFHDLLRDPYLKKEYVDLMAPEGLEFLAFLKRETLCAKHGRFDEAEVYYPPQEKIRDEFFNKLRDWRKKLRAELYKKYGKKYGKDDVDLGTQKILDRLIFIEVCTDKEILAGDVLASVLTADGRFYRVLKSQFERMDELFDTELFADHWIDDASITDKVIEPIIRGVAEVDFERLSVHVIGEVYEDYLGELLREKGRGVSGKKTKATRKAKGIYYTPEYIVDYIVTNTVGALLKKAKSEEDIKQVRVLDPACGSGSFLIRAFDEFAAAYERVLNKKGTAPLFGFDVKRSILEHNLYGVDIDARAVEITKLNLMIKALEGTKYQDLKGRKLLPNLSLNIRCGNSLVSGAETADKEGQLAIFGADHEADAKKLIALREQFYATRDDEEKEALLEEISDSEYEVNEVLNEGLREYFDDPTEIKPFNYTVAFPEVFRTGGFDAVIGNPPYSYRKSTTPVLKKYYRSRFLFAEVNFELYKFFVERGIFLIRRGGFLGMIVSATFLIQNAFKKLRRHLSRETSILKLAPLGPKAFTQATVDTAIIILTTRRPKNVHVISVLSPDSPRDLLKTEPYTIAQKRFRENDDFVFDYKLSENAFNIVERLFRGFAKLETGFDFSVGINTGFIRDELVSETKRDGRYHPMVPGTGISRYGAVITQGYIMYDRNYVIKRGKLGRTLPPEYFFNKDKILVVRTRNLSLRRRLIATYDGNKNYNLNRLSNIIARPGYNLFGLLGFLNSKLYNWIFSMRFFDYEIKPVYLKVCPLADVNENLLISLVEEILDHHKRLAAAKSDADKKRIQRAIDATDRKIDNLVYDLYGLTAEEIKIVEAG